MNVVQNSASGLRRRFNRVFVATLGFLLLTHGGHFYSVDNATVYFTAQVLMKTGGLAIEPGMMKELGGPATLVTAPGRGGKRYGHYGIGLSLLQAPLIAAGSLADMAYPGAFAAIVGPNASIFYPEDFSVFAATLVGPLFGALAAAEFWVIAEPARLPAEGCGLADDRPRGFDAVLARRAG